MKAYCQYDEQPAILSACGIADARKDPNDAGCGTLITPPRPSPPGRFLDIGGYDPCDKSNTRALYECGWSGLIIEPEPNALLRLLSGYGKGSDNDGRVQLLSAAVGLEPSWGSRMWVTADGTTTDREDFYDKWKDTVTYTGEILVPHITLPQIQLQFGAFDMVSIDIEGVSADLAIQLFSLGWECKCVVVEHDDRMVEIGQAATRRGYRMTLINGTNAVFAK